MGEPIYRTKDSTWTRLPQGFKNSPTIFGNQLAKELEGWKTDSDLDKEHLVLQYVDDILSGYSDKGHLFAGNYKSFELFGTKWIEGV